MSILPKEDKNDEFIHKFLVQKGAGFIVGESSEPNTPTSLNNSYEDETEEIEPFQSFIMQQGAEGSWKLTQKFAETIGFSYEELIEASPSNIGKQNEGALSVWATILALKFLEVSYEDFSEKWELLAKKAKSWLSNEIQKMKLQIEEIENAAAKLLRD